MILRAKPIATTLEEKTPIPEQKSLLPTAPYYSISLKERRRNPEFAQLTENMTRETLVRHLQRQFRSRHGYRFTGKYIESLRVPLSLQFLRFPHGNKYLEHAERIRIIKNGWTLLDYNDPEFTRNIYKALHLGKITLNEMVTALLIHDFKEAHPESFAIKQYPFGSKGPYYVEDITYISVDRLKAFKKSLKQLPLHETCYFSLRVSRLFEVSFIYDAIQRRFKYEVQHPVFHMIC